MNSSKSDLELLLERLVELKVYVCSGFLKEDTWYHKQCGICNNVICCQFDTSWLRRQFKKLGYLSIEYPVESMISKNFSDWRDMYVYSDHEKYNPSTECGKERLKLLDNLIKSATSELEELYK